MKKLFGTDGVRGLANVDLTAEMALGLARAAADGRSGTAVVGRDTRRSGQMLAAAVHAGFNAAGFDSTDLGIIPVGAVCHLTRSSHATFGVMVSASHNPAADNGIKFFGTDGAKLDDDRETAIESRYQTDAPWVEVSGEALGIQVPMVDALDRYVGHLAAQADYRLAGIPVLLDCAHGAAFLAAPRLFAGLGAEVEAINTEPSGMNINDGCGAVSPGMLAERAKGRMGLAFDGDADRCIAVDEDGMVCNGDVIMAILARHLKTSGELPGDLVVATVMSNLGFRLALRGMGLDVVETPVGDRHVLEEMRRPGAGLGGEQSGHVIFGGEPTGDGLLTGLRLLEVDGRHRGSSQGVAPGDDRVPPGAAQRPGPGQGTPARGRSAVGGGGGAWRSASATTAGCWCGRRGTEPLVRVMVEARDGAEAAGIADDLVLVVRRELGGETPATGLG